METLTDYEWVEDNVYENGWSIWYFGKRVFTPVPSA